MRKTAILFSAFAVSIIFSVQGCNSRSDGDIQAEFAVTNSYLQSVVKDICGDDTEVFSMAPPGMCPGHFDITPSQAQQLSNCKLLLLFDFQSKLEDSLSGLKDKGLRTSQVKILPGMCITQTYMEACREVCEILVSLYPENEEIYRQRFTLIQGRMENLSDELKTKMIESGLESVQVLASSHQSEFVNWLGLETVSTFTGSDSETAFNINNAINKAKQQDVRFIIANKQEGTYLADALSDRLGTQTVVFSNFPESDIGSVAFDQLVRQNVDVLIETAQK